MKIAEGRESDEERKVKKEIKKMKKFYKSPKLKTILNENKIKMP